MMYPFRTASYNVGKILLVFFLVCIICSGFTQAKRTSFRISGHIDREHGRNQLQWVAPKAPSINFYEVESSNDGRTFGMAAIIWVLPHSNNQYFFRDKQRPGKIYYRVKQVAESGSETYSNTLLLQ